MKKKTIVISIFLVLLMISAIPVASALTTTSSMLYVSSYSMDPAVLYPYEQGTVSVTLGNSGNQSVGLSNPNLISDTITIDKKDSWNTMSYIASGSTITYSFLVSYPLQKIGQTNLSGLLA
ncbi:MAG: hypothetical protein WCH85_03120, partial [Methanomicrobiales archaeon]